MSLKKFEKYIKILKYIYENKDVTRMAISSNKEFGIKYITLDKLLTKWVDEGFITKDRIEKIAPGGEQHTYSITEDGIKFLDARTSGMESIKFNDYLREELLDISEQLPDLSMKARTPEELKKEFLKYIKKNYGFDL